jgi:hypothetical protein
MADNQEISVKLKEMLDLAGRSFEADNSEGYEVLGEQLEELETLAQKTFQEHTDSRSLARKLENGDSLSPDELTSLKSLMVGDAEYYMKYDDDFDRSKSELKRILDEISRLQAGNMDFDQIMHLEVLCREASSVAKPTTFYMEQKERVRKFDDATRGGIDRESGKLLADILRGI